MYNFKADTWDPLIEAYNEGNKVSFDNEFMSIYRDYVYAINYKIQSHFNCNEEIASDCAHEAIYVLLANIHKRKELVFNNEREIFSYLYKIAYNKAVEFIFRVPNERYMNDSDDIAYTPKFIDQPTGNIFRDMYAGEKDIDEFLKSEFEAFKLLKLKYLNNLSYKEILALEEYSDYTEVSLRKKVSRIFNKYKNFIKE